MQVGIGSKNKPVYKFFFNKNSRNLSKLEELIENAKRKKKSFPFVYSEKRKNGDLYISVIPPKGYNKRFEDACETVGLSFEKYTEGNSMTWIV